MVWLYSTSPFERGNWFMARYVPPEKMTVEQILTEIEREYTRWNYIANNGCQDPFWPDGCNMKLVRNHIIYWYSILQTKKEAELAAIEAHQAHQAQQTQLSLFSESEEENDNVITFTIRPLPPEVPDNYMVSNCEYSDRLKNRRTGDLVWGNKGEYKA